MASLPARLPHTVMDLIDELDHLNPAPVVEGPLTDQEQIQKLVWIAGRRSVINELILTRDRNRKESLDGSISSSGK